jgi:hypothetical protein
VSIQTCNINTWPADLYAIIKATEKLERAYVRDAIPPEAYEQACERLIAQFKVRDKDRWICCFR